MWFGTACHLAPPPPVPPLSQTRTCCPAPHPAGVLYAASLWLSNSAYLYLSVSFIQMTKSLMPGLVYACGVALKVEQVGGWIEGRWGVRGKAHAAPVKASQLGVVCGAHIGGICTVQLAGSRAWLGQGRCRPGM